VERILSRMTLAQKVAQLFMVPVNGADLTREVRDWQVGGLILFGYDVGAPEQWRSFIAGAQRLSRLPLLIATDEEGGDITSISPAVVPPLLSPHQYGLMGSTGRVYQDALATGRGLRALGIMMDLAPVVDVLDNPDSPIGDRSFGADPALAARLGAAAVGGLQAAGIAATAKHFLGLGSVAADAHRALPLVERTRTQLEAVELVPMRAAVAAGVDALMVTHSVIPALDPSGTPASLSPRIMSYIRHQLGFKGLIITDSLAMGGLTVWVKTNEEASVRAIAAGADIALLATVATVVRRAMDDVQHAVVTRRIPIATIDDAVRHVLQLKLKLGLLRS
jgi:beta-N-acetylhexosaminidase